MPHPSHRKGKTILVAAPGREIEATSAPPPLRRAEAETARLHRAGRAWINRQRVSALIGSFHEDQRSIATTS
jgi:hypothetical protein